MTAVDARPRAARGVVRLAHSLPLEHGGELRDARVGYELLGDPDLPTVVVLGGISAGRHVAASAEDAQPGWWEGFVGDGLAVDTRAFGVVGIDFLGGTGASSGAELLPRDGGAVAAIDTRDQARALAAALDHLGVHRAHAVVGASYGGMVALAFASLFGERLDRLVVIGAAHESHPMATALRALQRRVVRLACDAGREWDGVALARGLAVTSYRTAEEFAARFGVAPAVDGDTTRFPVERYLEHHGARFADRFPASSYLCLSRSIDLHRVDPATVRTPAALVGFDSDALVPPWQLRALHERLGGPASLDIIPSIYGHDAFLKEGVAVSAAVARALAAGDVS